MQISARVLADSLAPCGAHLTTMEWTYPRCIHAEIMTHRMLSKNSASSRAIPVKKMLERIMEHPFIPKVWGSNKPGMQAGEEIQGEDRRLAIEKWLLQRDHSVGTAGDLAALGLHKQIPNRLVEPWMWITIIVSATSFDNVWGLRCHPAAEPHFQELAYKARDAMEASEPKKLKAGEWHLPLIYDEDWRVTQDIVNPSRDHFHGNSTALAEVREASERLLLKVSVGRCARVSYLTHSGKRDLKEDIALHDKLVVAEPKHATPAEHVAQAMDWPEWSTIKSGNVYSLRDLVVERRRERNGRPGDMDMENEVVLGELTSGNFLGFSQYRKQLETEHIGGLMP